MGPDYRDDERDGRVLRIDREVAAMKTRIHILYGVIGIVAIPALLGAVALLKGNVLTGAATETNAQQIGQLQGEVEGVRADVQKVDRKLEGLSVSLNEWRDAESERDAQQNARLERLESRHWRIRRRRDDQ